MKVGERIAQEIVDDIAGRGWPVGEVLGTEPELMAAYGVSRGTFREAVRILEHLGCARMREGRNGGLMVTAPESGPVTRAAAVYLRYQGVDTASLHSARRTIELDLVARATARMDEADARLLLAALAAELEAPEGLQPGVSPVHTAIAGMAGNQPLALFAMSLMSLSDEYGRPRLSEAPSATVDAEDASRRAHEKIVAAMVAGDVETATRRMRVHLDAVERWMEGRDRVADDDSGGSMLR